MTKGTPKYVCFTLTMTYVLIHLNSWKYQRFFVSIKSKHIRSHKSNNAPLIKQRKIDQNLWITFQNWPSIHFSLCYNNLFIVWTGWLQTSFQIKMKKKTTNMCKYTYTRTQMSNEIHCYPNVGGFFIAAYNGFWCALVESINKFQHTFIGTFLSLRVNCKPQFHFKSLKPWTIPFFLYRIVWIIIFQCYEAKRERKTAIASMFKFQLYLNISNGTLFRMIRCQSFRCFSLLCEMFVFFFSIK